MILPGCISKSSHSFSKVLIPTISFFRSFCIADWLISPSFNIFVLLYPLSFNVSSTLILYVSILSPPNCFYTIYSNPFCSFCQSKNNPKKIFLPIDFKRFLVYYNNCQEDIEKGGCNPTKTNNRHQSKRKVSRL